MIASELNAAGVRRNERYFAPMTTQKTLFGRLKDVRDPARDLFGWYVGDYLWVFPNRETSWSIGKSIGRLRTVVCLRGDVLPVGHGPEAKDCSLYAKGLYLGFSAFATSEEEPDPVDLWQQIIDRLHAVARSSGVTLSTGASPTVDGL
ncbi:hypothetical protein [Micromonospora sp. NBC_00858]|uniref:hypothetical protein n=1 Tax=Micromonospora sp. NBC_00858 TaxID=2975979 RepID=UPI0038702D03|nr:hypothetical protein OG990_16065 [Micromonospora sp. NBC_00858]